MHDSKQPWSADPVDPSVVSPQSGLRKELGIVARGRDLIALSLAVFLLTALAVNFGARPLYQSASIVSLDEAGVSSLKARASVDRARKAEALSQQVRLLQSAELALLAVNQAEPIVLAELAKGPLGNWRDRIEEETRNTLGFPRHHGTASPDLVQAFRSRLVVQYEPPATWVHVRFTGYDAVATAAAVNRLMDTYLEETAKETAGAAGASRQQVEQLVTKRQGRVVETLDKLQSFDDTQGLQNVETRQVFLEKELARLQDSLITARQNQLSRRGLMEEAKRLRPSEALAIPSVRDDGEIAATRSRIAEVEARLAQNLATLGDRHPEVLSLRSELEFSRSRLAERIAALKEGILRDYRNAAREEADIASAIARTQEELSGLKKNSVERTFIEKQAEAGQRALGELIAKSVKDADEEVFFAPTILQRAEPAKEPVSPRKGQNLQYALVLGLLVGLSLSWLRWHLDETVRTPEELKAAIPLPLLGMVPRARATDFDLFGPESDATLRLFEAYRVLRTNLTLGTEASAKSQFVLMTSSREAEGKTTTSCGLGISLAQAGHRVLLIDGDLRRESLSRLVSTHRGPGLTDALEGRPLEQCVVATRVAGLDLMPSGTRRPNPAEILGREGLLRMIASLRSHYDWILCDAPPVLAVADAAILCRAADAVLVVVGANATPLGSIRASLDQLAAVGARVRAMVLNNVDLSRDSHYYKYYYSAHYAGYGNADKKPRGRSVAARPPAGR